MEKHSGIQDIFLVFDRAIEKKKSSNLGKYEREYIVYNQEEDMRTSYARKGYAVLEDVDRQYMDMIRKIPFHCFMSIEKCYSVGGKEEGYCLETYSPGKIPLLEKCRLFTSSEDEQLLHRHDYFEMIYVFSGRRKMVVENQEIFLKEHEIGVFDIQCAHRDIRSESEGIAFYFCFDRNMIDSWFLKNLNHPKLNQFFKMKREKKGTGNYLYLKVNENRKMELEEEIRKFFFEMEQFRTGYDKIIQVCILRMFLCIISEENSVVVIAKKLHGTKLFQAVAKYISSNIAEISLEKLCEEFHYQADYYNRLIKKNTSFTYSEYVKSLRIEKAKNLLINTDLPIHAIMEYIGFKYNAYFYKIFQQNTGMTPLEYRKNKEKS